MEFFLLLLNRDLSYNNIGQTLDYRRCNHMENIGEIIQNLIDKKGIKQRELARRLGKSHTHINRIIKGEKIPNLKLLQEIANVLNEDLNIFGVDFTEEEQNLMNDLELTDDELINKYNLTVDGKKVSEKELRLFLNQVRIMREGE